MTAPYSEDNLIAISALQHWLYCPRQCALIHLEQVWEENRFTAEGRILHRRAHDGPDESRPGVRIARGMPVRSLEIGLTGQCDVVEFHRDGKVVPIEYKRGRPKAHRADEVQVCAQALCLEEMLSQGRDEAFRSIPVASLFYGKQRRRKDVLLDEALRDLTLQVASEVHAMLEGGMSPVMEYEAHRCGACSLLATCAPRALRFRRGANQWFQQRLKETHQNRDELS